MLWHYTYFDHEVCRLHEHIADFLRRAKAEGRVPRKFSLVQHCCPELRARSENSPNLRAKLKAFYTVFVGLRPRAKQKTFDAFQAVNSIDGQLANRRERYAIKDLPEAVRVPAKKLFVYLYTHALGAGGRITDHWGKFYAQLESKDCPFCAIEPLHHPDFYKQDYDHLLCKDIYPFAAVNMRNLVPMGRDCNTIFKRTKDVLCKNGSRRRAFQPFNSSGVRIQIDLSGSQPPTATNRKGKWKIRVKPGRQEVATWVDLFDTPARYEKEVLQTRAVAWIGEFRNVVKCSTKPSGGWTVPRLRNILGRYAKSFNGSGYGELHFLKGPFYDLLHRLDSREFLTPLLKSIR
jgi:hypothetical protein